MPSLRLKALNRKALNREVREQRPRRTQRGSSGPLSTVSGDLLDCFFVALGGVVHRAVEELVQQPEQLQFTEDVVQSAVDALPVQKRPEMLLREQEGPGQSRERYPLVRPAGTESFVDLLDVLLRLGKQPFAEIAIDFVAAMVQFAGRHFSQISGPLRREEFLSESFGQFFGMSFDEMYEAKCNHGRPPCTAL